jgi:hypothetical protein
VLITRISDRHKHQLRDFFNRHDLLTPIHPARKVLRERCLLQGNRGFCSRRLIQTTITATMNAIMMEPIIRRTRAMRTCKGPGLSPIRVAAQKVTVVFNSTETDSGQQQSLSSMVCVTFGPPCISTTDKQRRSRRS